LPVVFPGNEKNEPGTVKKNQERKARELETPTSEGNGQGQATQENQKRRQGTAIAGEFWGRAEKEHDQTRTPRGRSQFAVGGGRQEKDWGKVKEMGCFGTRLPMKKKSARDAGEKPTPQQNIHEREGGEKSGGGESDPQKKTNPAGADSGLFKDGGKSYHGVATQKKGRASPGKY